MPPSVNFGGSAVAGIGSPGLKKPTGSKGSLEMSSEGCGATVLAAREVLGTSRPKVAMTPTTGARTRRAFKIYVPPKSCVLQGGSRRLQQQTQGRRPTCGLAYSPPLTGGEQRCSTRHEWLPPTGTKSRGGALTRWDGSRGSRT